ncbi:single-stranded DNA-binding protein [Streptomyces minutiscleroticus]|uniref:single-stranded DNA-binding protein n=1 Tax=Streptomyces minutiscleroticus TaxID=68238 RepID=UPI003329BFC8
MAPSDTHVSGTVTGDAECRFTDSGIAVARFRLVHVPAQWDAATRQWRDGTPVRYVCTVWRDLARTATESLVDGVRVMVSGRVTEIRDNCIHLSVDEVGLSLRQRIAYTEASLPSPAAAAPMSPAAPVASVAAPAPAEPAEERAARPATRRAGGPPGWWEQERAAGWHRPARTPAADVSPSRR